MQDVILAQMFAPTASNAQAIRAAAQKSQQSPVKKNPAGFDRILKAAANRQDYTQDGVGKTIDKSTDAVKRAFEDSKRADLTSSKRETEPPREVVESKSEDEKPVDREVDQQSSQDNSSEAANAAALANSQPQNETQETGDSAEPLTVVDKITLSATASLTEKGDLKVAVMEAAPTQTQEPESSEQTEANVLGNTETKASQSQETKPVVITGSLPEQSKTESGQLMTEQKTEVDSKSEAVSTASQPIASGQTEQPETSLTLTSAVLNQQEPAKQTQQKDEVQVKAQVQASAAAVASNQGNQEVAVQTDSKFAGKDAKAADEVKTDAAEGDKQAKDAPAVKVLTQKDSSQTRQETNSNTANQDNSSQSAKTDVKKLIDTETGKLRGLTKSEVTAETKDNAAQPATTTVNRLDVMENGSKISAVKSDVQAPKLDTKDIMNQIVQKAEVMVKDNKSAITIDLKPEFLGKLQISLSVQDGVVTAKFTTENQNVKQLLEGGLSQLKSVFENNGIKLEKAEVNVDLGNSGSSYQGFNESQARQDRYTELPDRWWDNRSETGGYAELQQTLLPAADPAVEYSNDGVNFLI